MNHEEETDPLARALGPPMGAWQLLRLASAVIVLASLAGVVTRYLPPSMGREGDAARADMALAFFTAHAVVWAAVFVFATRRCRQAKRGE
jgi:hypothetical protein